MNRSGESVHPEVFRVLVVCTGNICRSPMAERLLEAGLHARVGPARRWVQVESAGTFGLAGEPMDAEARNALAGLGVTDVADFRARGLTVAMIDRAHLVLTASREHRSHVIGMAPLAAPRTFTIRELDRLAAAVDADQIAPGTPRERGQRLVAAAAAMRGRTEFVEPETDDIADPYRRPAAEFVRSAKTIAAALARPLDLLTGSRP